jgi:hypothetical protein
LTENFSGSGNEEKTLIASNKEELFKREMRKRYGFNLINQNVPTTLNHQTL